MKLLTFEITKTNLESDSKNCAIENKVSKSNNNLNEIENVLKEIIDGNNLVDCDSLMEKFFPFKENCQIFISHSYKDLKMVNNFKNTIKNKFELNCFIDSEYWYNCYEILKEIDNKYSISSENKNIYVYEKRNKTTSALYTILNLSLQKMIFNAEYFIFFKTHNSSVNESTYSPWIYSELFLANNLSTKKEELKKSEQKNSLLFNFNIDNIIKDNTIKFDEFDNINSLFEKIIKENSENSDTFKNYFSKKISDIRSDVDKIKENNLKEIYKTIKEIIDYV